MNKSISSIIDADQLVTLRNSADLVLVDARTGPGARDVYEGEHLAGALYVDLDKDLAEIPQDAAQGGRHPLPKAERFSDLLGRLGIDPESHVVVYDAKSAANAAARFWWMLKSVGHNKVQVLNGGFGAAVAAGFSTSNNIEEPKVKASYPAKEWLLPQADLPEVLASAGKEQHIVIDVREQRRYDGIEEPIDLIAGHIPGAINMPYTNNLDDKGFFLSPAALNAMYSNVLSGVPPANTIVHCGSGVTACHTLLAMDIAGLPMPRLYTGSWSEWSRNELPIATNIAN